MSYDDDGPPPLEDMTEQLQAMKINKQNFISSSLEPSATSFLKNTYETPSTSSSPVTSTTTSSATTPVTSVPVKSNTTATSNSSATKSQFSGLRGGFFNKPSTAKKSTSTATAKSSSHSVPASVTSNKVTETKSNGDEIPFIKAQATQKNSLQLEEVQSAMNMNKMPNLAENTDFMSKLKSNPKLLKAMLHPQMAAAMAEIQKDPQAAIRKYADNKEVTEFLMEFMKLMGGHFTQLAETMPGDSDSGSVSNTAAPSSASSAPIRELSSSSSTPTSSSTSTSTSTTSPPQPRQVEPETIQRWMSNPQIRDVLNDSRTSEMLTAIQRDSENFVKYANHPSIQLLIRAGILQVPPQYAKTK